MPRSSHPVSPLAEGAGPTRSPGAAAAPLPPPVAAVAEPAALENSGAPLAGRQPALCILALTFISTLIS